MEPVYHGVSAPRLRCILAQSPGESMAVVPRILRSSVNRFGRNRWSGGLDLAFTVFVFLSDPFYRLNNDCHSH